jgi:excinuclease ABC subunit C
MANDNAREAFNRSRSISEDPALTELKRRLRIKRLPRVIEAIDISNMGESFAVGAMVTFVDGLPAKNRYRRYRIKTVKGQDDFAMMREVLSRRFGGADKERALPDLLLVDGGKGQLGMAVEVARELGLEGVAMAGLAKERVEGDKRKHERVFLVGVKDPVQLREGSKGEFLLMRVRDEVHRFAVTYHRKLRSKAIGSILDTIAGIGPKKRRALFDEFKDLDGIRAAGVDELAAVSGITVSIARLIKDELA